MEKLGRPVTATSANVSGRPPAADAGEVRQQLCSPAPDFILDGGPLSHGTCSTIVDVADGAVPQIIRRGVIPPEEVHSVAAC